MQNLISVIIPFYKKRKYFIKTINSLKNQSYKNYEVIVVYDDTDKSDLIFFALQDGNIWRDKWNRIIESPLNSTQE